MEPIVYVASVAYGEKHPVHVGTLLVDDASDDEACRDSVISCLRSEYPRHVVACHHVVPAKVVMHACGQSSYVTLSCEDVEMFLDGSDLHADKSVGRRWHTGTSVDDVVSAVGLALDEARGCVLECVSASLAVAEARDMCVGAQARGFVALDALVDALASHVASRRLDIIGRTCLRTYVDDDSLSDSQVESLASVVGLGRDGVRLFMSDFASPLSSESASVAYNVINDRVCEAMLAYPEHVVDAGDELCRAMSAFLRASERAAVARRLSGLSIDWIGSDGECRRLTDDERDVVAFARRFLCGDVSDVTREVREMAEVFVWDFSGHRVSSLRSRVCVCDVDVVSSGRVSAGFVEETAAWGRRRKEADEALLAAMDGLFSSGIVRRMAASLSVPRQFRGKLRRIVNAGYVTCESIVQSKDELMSMPGIGLRTVDVLTDAAREALREGRDSSVDVVDLCDRSCDEVVVRAWDALLARCARGVLSDAAPIVSALTVRGNEVSACRMSEAEVLKTNEDIAMVGDVVAHVKALFALWDVEADLVRDLCCGDFDELCGVISDVCPYDVPFATAGSDDFEFDEPVVAGGDGSRHGADVTSDDVFVASGDGGASQDVTDDTALASSVEDDLPPVSDPFTW